MLKSVDVRGKIDTGQATAISATRSPVAVAHEIGAFRARTLRCPGYECVRAQFTAQGRDVEEGVGVPTCRLLGFCICLRRQPAAHFMIFSARKCDRCNTDVDGYYIGVNTAVSGCTDETGQRRTKERPPLV
jgi:hypothetical protein